MHAAVSSDAILHDSQSVTTINISRTMTSKERPKLKSVPEIYDRKDSEYHFNLGSVKLGINITTII
jgi:hypothetical protein